MHTWPLEKPVEVPWYKPWSWGIWWPSWWHVCHNWLDDSGRPVLLHQERTLDFLPPFQWHQVFLCCRCCSVAQLCPTLRDSMDCSTPALPVFHHLPEFAQWWGIIHFTGALATDVAVFLVFCYKQCGINDVDTSFCSYASTGSGLPGSKLCILSFSF